MISSLLIISHELVGQYMAGAAIRSWELADALAQTCEVSLAVPAPSMASSAAFRTPEYQLDKWDTLLALVAQADCLLFSPHLLNYFPQLVDCDKLIIIDGYDPAGIELLMQHAEDDPVTTAQTQQTLLTSMYRALAIGDFFLCASERQRAWWLGALEVASRINPYTVRDDPTLHQLIDIVPFGVSSKPRCATRRVMRGVIAGIGDDDPVVLWGGGLWQWLDPITLIQAVPLLTAELPRLRVVFPGTRAPRLGGSTPMPIAQRAINLADELGLTGRHVFFGDWVAYEDWLNYLLEADIAVSLHQNHIETYLSWRTRSLSYVWAGLPMVLTRGDILAELLSQSGMAILTPPEDPAAVAQAIAHWVSQPNAKANLRPIAQRLAESFSWSNVIQPLQDFIRRGKGASDRKHQQANMIHNDYQLKTAIAETQELRSRVRILEDALLSIEAMLPVKAYRRLRHLFTGHR